MKTVKLTLRMKKDLYEQIKVKAKAADISINKLINRAGVVVKVEDIVRP